MTILIGVLLALGVGGGLSVLFFGGLWWTVQEVVEHERPQLLLLGSFVLRSALVLLGFSLVLLLMGTHWELLAASLLGFIGGRTVLVRRWRPQPTRTNNAH